MSQWNDLPLFPHQQQVCKQAGLLWSPGCLPHRHTEGHQESLLPGQCDISLYEAVVKKYLQCLFTWNFYNCLDTFLRKRVLNQMLPRSLPSSFYSYYLFYLQLAKKYHPDTSPDDPDAKEKFAKLAEAYEVQNR